jgi:hypothetical protein
MTKNEFYERLQAGDLQVTFTKKTDGTTRVLKCTSNVPADKLSQVEGRQKTNTDLVTVFDIDAKDWRSFWPDSIQEVVDLDTSFRAASRVTEDGAASTLPD